MENSKEPFSQEGKQSEFSFISLVISFLLGISFIVFLQFSVGDVTRTLYGEKPKQPSFVPTSKEDYQNKSIYYYKGTYYEEFQEAQGAFEKSELIPYETKALIVKTLINAPLFLLAIGLFFSLGKTKSSYKLITGTFFVAMVLNMFTLLKDLGIYVYRINERLAIYGISLFLIIIFAISVILVQEKVRSKTTV